MSEFDEAISRYRQSGHGAVGFATRCREARAAAGQADQPILTGTKLLETLTSDAAKAVDARVHVARKRLATITDTLARWAEATDSFAAECSRLVHLADARSKAISHNRRLIASMVAESRGAADGAAGIEPRRRMLEREIDDDAGAVHSLLRQLDNAEEQLARALETGQDRVGATPGFAVRAVGARVHDVDYTGDADYLWVHIVMGIDSKAAVAYDFVDPPLPLFRLNEHGEPVISGSDVSQGVFGDCWFIATLMAIADQNPEIIERMITQDPISKLYTVTLYDEDGQPHPIEVDGRLLLAKDGKPVGAGWPEDKVLWPAIAEKALAEYWGGYPEIEGDDPRKAIRLITGETGLHTDWFNPGPVEWFDGEDTNREALGATIDGGGIAVASTKKYPEGEHPQGLVGGHAYQVVDVTGDVVTIQNPWGTDNNDPIQLTWDDFHGLFQRVSWSD